MDAPLELNMSAELRRLGKEKRLIVAAHMPKFNPDSALIKVVVRAHDWFEMLKNRKVESISDLARIENVQRTYPSRIIPLAFLAPDITEAILEGRQPIDLTLDRLMTAMPLPLAWDMVAGGRTRARCGGAPWSPFTDRDAERLCACRRAGGGTRCRNRGRSAQGRSAARVTCQRTFSLNRTRRTVRDHNANAMGYKWVARGGVGAAISQCSRRECRISVGCGRSTGRT